MALAKILKLLIHFNGTFIESQRIRESKKVHNEINVSTIMNASGA